MRHLETWMAAALLCQSGSLLAQSITFDAATGIDVRAVHRSAAGS